MLKILLVDDEVAICRGMKKLILKTGLEGLTVVEAYDGVEALELLETFDPDVLLTDMKMPRMDGLQLLREAKTRKPGLLTAVISAYSDYAYIREAILLHEADDYLLKPATAKQIEELLGKLLSKLQEQRDRDERETLDRLLKGQTLEIIPTYMSDRRYALLLLSAGPYSQGLHEHYPGTRWPAAQLERLTAHCDTWQVKFWLKPGERLHEQVLVAAFADDLSRERVEHDLDQIKSLFSGSKWPISGAWLSDLRAEELLDGVVRLRRVLVGSLPFGKSAFLRLGTGESSPPSINPAFAEAENAAIVAAGNSQKASFLQAILVLLKSWEQGGASQASIQQSLLRISAVFGVQGRQRQEELDRILSGSSGYTELHAPLVGLFDELFEAQTAGFSKPEPSLPLVNQVERYLKRHYSSPITLQSLSREFKLVPNYLSVLFKRHMGVTPMEYLMDYRIQEAKRLMNERPGLLLKQVASEVGYPDPLYFSRVFRKRTGQSPTEYALARQSVESSSIRP